MGIRIGDKKNRKKDKRILFLPLVVSMHGGRLAFCMCTSPAACGQWECHIHPRTCLCVPCYERFSPSHILRLDLAASHPHRTVQDKSRPIVATANTWPCAPTPESLRSAGRDGGLALALFTLSTTICQHGYIWVVFHVFGFRFHFFSSSNVCRRWTFFKLRKIWLANCSLDFKFLFKMPGNAGVQRSQRVMVCGENMMVWFFCFCFLYVLV